MRFQQCLKSMPSASVSVKPFPYSTIRLTPDAVLAPRSLSRGVRSRIRARGSRAF